MCVYSVLVLPFLSFPILMTVLLLVPRLMTVAYVRLSSISKTNSRRVRLPGNQSLAGSPVPSPPPQSSGPASVTTAHTLRAARVACANHANLFPATHTSTETCDSSAPHAANSVAASRAAVPWHANSTRSAPPPPRPSRGEGNHAHHGQTIQSHSSSWHSAKITQEVTNISRDHDIIHGRHRLGGPPGARPWGGRRHLGGSHLGSDARVLACDGLGRRLRRLHHLLEGRAAVTIEPPSAASETK